MLNHNQVLSHDLDHPIPLVDCDWTNQAESYKSMIAIYDAILKALFETVGYISGGFCPEPCEHTTLQNTDPYLYARLTNVWSVYKKTNELVQQLNHHYDVVLPTHARGKHFDEPF